LAEEADDTAEAGAEVDADAGFEVDAGGIKLSAVSSCGRGLRLGVAGVGSARRGASKGWTLGSSVGGTA
jgi:hypothetical protein